MGNRWKNYGLWASIVAFIPLFTKSLGAYDIMVVLPDNYTELVTTVLSILVLAGIISNPTTGNRGYKDE